MDKNNYAYEIYYNNLVMCNVIIENKEIIN